MSAKDTRTPLAALYQLTIRCFSEPPPGTVAMPWGYHAAVPASPEFQRNPTLGWVIPDCLMASEDRRVALRLRLSWFHLTDTRPAARSWVVSAVPCSSNSSDPGIVTPVLPRLCRGKAIALRRR